MEKTFENFTEFLDTKGLSDRTMIEYLRCFQNLPPFEKIKDLKDEVSRYLSNHKGKVARAFLKNYLEFIGREDIKLPKFTGRKKRRFITPLTDRQLINIAHKLYNDNVIYGIMFELQLDGGMRIDELSKVRVDDFITLTEWVQNPTEPCRLKIYGKGNRERVVLISPSVMDKVAVWMKYLAGSQENPDKLFEISKFSYWRHLKKAGESLGVHVYPHLVRHTKASQLRRDNFDLIDIKNFLGHADISTTQLYVHESEEDTLDKFRNYIKSQEEAEKKR